MVPHVCMCINLQFFLDGICQILFLATLTKKYQHNNGDLAVYILIKIFILQNDLENKMTKIG